MTGPRTTGRASVSWVTAAAMAILGLATGASAHTIADPAGRRVRSTDGSSIKHRHPSPEGHVESEPDEFVGHVGSVCDWRQPMTKANPLTPAAAEVVDKLKTAEIASVSGHSVRVTAPAGASYNCFMYAFAEDLGGLETSEAWIDGTTGDLQGLLAHFGYTEITGRKRGGDICIIADSMNKPLHAARILTVGPDGEPTTVQGKFDHKGLYFGHPDAIPVAYRGTAHYFGRPPRPQ